MNKTCKRRFIIWCADANGELGRDGKGKTRKNHTGPRQQKNNWTIHTRRKNGKRERRTTTENMPETANDTDGDMEEAVNSQARKWKHQQQRKISPKKDGREKYKTNTARRGQAMAEMRADRSVTSRSTRSTETQHGRRRATYIDMPTWSRINSTDYRPFSYTTTPPRNTRNRCHQRHGGRLKYDIQELRLRTWKLTKR